MPAPRSEIGLSSARENCFATTHWSVVLAAGQTLSSNCSEALETLCRSYWYPLYAYVRRRGYVTHDAQDLTQEFFACLLEKNYLGKVKRTGGKFRSFLLASLGHFLANEWDKTKAEKRGGKVTVISLDDETAESRYRLEPVSELSPEKLYDRRWAMTLLDQALVRLRQGCVAAGKTTQFELLKVFLDGETSAGAYQRVSTELNMTPNSIAVAVHRLRQRYRELVREEIAQTVASPADLEDEMRHLFTILNG